MISSRILTNVSFSQIITHHSSTIGCVFLRIFHNLEIYIFVSFIFLCFWNFKSRNQMKFLYDIVSRNDQSLLVILINNNHWGRGLKSILKSILSYEINGTNQIYDMYMWPTASFNFVAEFKIINMLSKHFL